MLVEIYIGHIK